MTGIAPAERIALTVAKAQVDRGETVTPNVAVVVTLTLARVVGAIDALDRAIDDHGSHPVFHRRIAAKHRAEWPTLWRAIDALRGGHDRVGV